MMQSYFYKMEELKKPHKLATAFSKVFQHLVYKVIVNGWKRSV